MTDSPFLNYPGALSLQEKFYLAGIDPDFVLAAWPKEYRDWLICDVELTNDEARIKMIDDYAQLNKEYKEKSVKDLRLNLPSHLHLAIDAFRKL